MQQRPLTTAWHPVCVSINQNSSGPSVPAPILTYSQKTALFSMVAHYEQREGVKRHG